MILKNNSHIHIIGGGPAGSFLAIHLLREAKAAGTDIQITIIDKCIVNNGDLTGEAFQYKGCNFCAGVISPTLHRELIKYDIRVPSETICEDFTHVWLHGRWKNFPLRVPPGQKLLSVFRGNLPPDRENSLQGLDSFLLKHAMERGAAILPGTVRDISYAPSRTPRMIVETASGESALITSDFLCICTGVNAFPGKRTKENPLFIAYKKINPSFIPPKVRPALMFEMKPGRRYLKQHMDKELYLIISGSGQLNLEHIALIPKRDYLSVVLVGTSIDKARFPDDTPKILNAFFALAHVKAILPGMTPENASISCSCYPMMALKPAQSPVAERIAISGDALGARLYRDGLHSAFVSARVIAKTVVHKGVDKKHLKEAGNRITRWLKRDNFYCSLMFSLLQKGLKSEIISRILYQAFATEMKFKKTGAWPLGSVLWKIGSGSADYGHLIKEFFSFPVFCSFTTGTIKTVRNILTEYFFGIKWGEYGRYPTVILKEKRSAIKKSIQAPLGIQLPAASQMERMYAIKVRASAKAIFEQLGKFGSMDANFLQLRFVDVKQTSGQPNEVGSIVTYRLKRSPIAMDIRLMQALANRTLLYEPQELFTSKGILLFDIAPTKDGNNRLVVYTAFDYKKGEGLPGKIFFTFFKWVFPDFAHDVVWNHAICTIKAAAEQSVRLIDQKQGLISQIAQDSGRHTS